jgi:hypothetical protein
VSGPLAGVTHHSDRSRCSASSLERELTLADPIHVVVNQEQCIRRSETLDRSRVRPASLLHYLSSAAPAHFLDDLHEVYGLQKMKCLNCNRQPMRR